jgi:4-amino-4-deoxy-L-arabinose transferase-like glycosyltransferase
MTERSRTAALPALVIRPVLVVVLIKSALNLAFASRYGWQRDELYYAVAGRHLQGGYVDFPPLTALVAALERVLFGDSLYGLRLFTILAGAIVVVLAALVARELGGSARAQTLAAVMVAFSPVLVSSNGLFQPVSFDQLTTMALLLLALRLALGRGNWVLLGLVVGVGLETKYTLAIVLVLLLATFAVFRRDLLFSRGLVLATAIAFVLFVPNLIWQLGHDWASVRFFVNPPPSASAESRPEYVANLLLVTGLVSVPVAVAGVRLLLRERALRALGWTVIGTVVAYFALNGKSYYAMPVLLFALAAGAIPLDGWLSPRRLWAIGTPFAVLFLAFLPIGMPVLPLATAERLGIIDMRTDYADELGWLDLARTVERVSGGADVVIAGNYGQAGALEVFGRGLPPIASGEVTFRYWRPSVTGRKAVIVGITRANAPYCRDDYRIVARIRMPVENEERGRPIARCTLTASLAQVWPQLLALYD